MKKLLLILYSTYGLVIFALVFLVLLPFFLLAIFIPPLEKMAATLNHIWARTFFFLLFLNRTQVTYETPLDKNQRYVFCANHFSFLDIPSMGLIPHNFKFIGKMSLKKVPLWGYMYSKLHILVDRKSLKSRHNSWLEVQAAIQRGFSMVFFPEGGILAKTPPQMVAFKEGAFRIAVNEQIPIVPVTIPYNHILLPDEKLLIMHPGKVLIKVHQPIMPTGHDDSAVKNLKLEVRKKMEEELSQYS